MKWLLLITTLPTHNATARMRAWRSVKASGAAALRDGVYLLPDSNEHHHTLTNIEQDVVTSGGTAYVLATETETYPLAELFDRSDDYRQLALDIHQLQASENRLTDSEFSRKTKKFNSEWATITSTDFFPGAVQQQTQALLDALEQRLASRLSPHEPDARRTRITPLRASDYQQRIWATRQRPWVDRLASAWLIQRFIDPQAQFIWLATPADCPADALGFDFDGARFSHVETNTGTLVSCEHLLASFQLQPDLALTKLASLVHSLDVGGLPVAEAAGLEHVLRGMRHRLQNDDALLAAAAQVFNDLYFSFQQETPAHE